jgi:hypothetical protein
MPVSISGNTGITFPDGSLQTAAASPLVLRNRIINGDMRIDQRNAGASVSPNASGYTLDRWSAQMNAASAKYSVQQTPSATETGYATRVAAGFQSYIGITSLGAYTVGAGEIMAIQQVVEGFNIADLAWGTANAKTVTLSFWVNCSLTGTFGGSFRQGSGTRSYPFTYTISSANTWEQKTITVAGDTSGTYASNNTAGLILSLGFGVGSTFSATAGAWAAGNFVSATGATSVVGTSGATFYITGVQLEQNTTATPFERRLYNQELANCQRYYFKTKTNSGFGPLYSATNNNTTGARGFFFLPVEMRVAPTGINMTGSTPNVGVGTYTSTVIDRATHTCVMLFLSGTGFTSGGASGVYGNADGTSCIDFTGAEL